MCIYIYICILCICMCIYIQIYGGFRTWWYPQIIHSNGVFHDLNHPAIWVPTS